jgi:hypothetical protein
VASIDNVGIGLDLCDCIESLDIGDRDDRRKNLSPIMPMPAGGLLAAQGEIGP